MKYEIFVRCNKSIYFNGTLHTMKQETYVSWNMFHETYYWWYRCFVRLKGNLLVPENMVRKQWVTRQSSLKKLFFAPFLNETENSCFPHKIANDVFIFFVYFFSFLEGNNKLLNKKKKNWVDISVLFQVMNFWIFTVFHNEKFFLKFTNMNRSS